MMVEPRLTPVIIPVERPIVATDVLLLVQVPPPPSVRVVVLPTQALVAPVIAPGAVTMVTVDVDTHPVPRA